MSKVLTSSGLISSIKRRAMIPSDQSTFTDDDFLDMLNEEIQYFAVPHLLRSHEEYLMVFEDFALDGTTNEYEIPYRAIGNKLRELSYVTNASGLTGSNTSEQVFELSRISVEDLPDYNNYFSSSYTENFYLKGNKVVLLGEFALTDAVLRMHFYLRPNHLVLEKNVGTISGIDTTNGIITVSNFPTTFSSLPLMDFVKHKSPNTILDYDLQPTAVNSSTKTITFAAADLPSDLEVGDYLCLAQETPVPQFPAELQGILAQRVAVAALEALGDQEGLVSAQRRLQDMEKASTDLIENRVEGAPEKINSRHSALKEAVISSSGFGRRGKF